METINVKGSGTMAIMAYIDDNEDMPLNDVFFRPSINPNYTLLVTDDKHSKVNLKELWAIMEENHKPHILVNGWERLQTDYMLGWLCRKNDRYIFISW